MTREPDPGATLTEREAATLAQIEAGLVNGAEAVEPERGRLSLSPAIRRRIVVGLAILGIWGAGVGFGLAIATGHTRGAISGLTTVAFIGAAWSPLFTRAFGWSTARVRRAREAHRSSSAERLHRRVRLNALAKRGRR